MKITKKQLKKMIYEATMMQLWAKYHKDAVKAADETIRRLDLTPETGKRTPGGMVESQIHRYLERALGYDRVSDEIFDVGDQALEVVALMLGLPKGTF